MFHRYFRADLGPPPGFATATTRPCQVGVRVGSAYATNRLGRGRTRRYSGCVVQATAHRDGRRQIGKTLRRNRVPGARDDTPIYACPDETVTGSAATRPGSPPPVFDFYQRLVHPNYPLLGIFITKGVGFFESTSLDDQLFAYYSAAYGSATATPSQPQWLVNELTFLESTAVIDKGELAPGVGVVVPQMDSAPPIVYRLEPRLGSDNFIGPQAFIRITKFIVPRSDSRTIAALTGVGFARWTPR